jgi:hypothetical protein
MKKPCGCQDKKTDIKITENTISTITTKEVEDTFKEIFTEEDGKVQSIESVYEKVENDKEDYFKLVISLHGISIEDTVIIHTKFVFKVDKDKKHLLDNSFIYLYDLNCIYKTVEFNSLVGIKNKILNIIKEDKFSNAIVSLSNFISSPVTLLNYYLTKEDVKNYSIFDMIYEPKFKTTPCNKLSLDFKFNIDNNYTITLSIIKKEPTDKEHERYIYQFTLNDKQTVVETDSVENIHSLVGSTIAKIIKDEL